MHLSPKHYSLIRLVSIIWLRADKSSRRGEKYCVICPHYTRIGDVSKWLLGLAAILGLAHVYVSPYILIYSTLWESSPISCKLHMTTEVMVQSPSSELARLSSRAPCTMAQRRVIMIILQKTQLTKHKHIPKVIQPSASVKTENEVLLLRCVRSNWSRAWSGANYSPRGKRVPSTLNNVWTGRTPRPMWAPHTVISKVWGGSFPKLK